MDSPKIDGSRAADDRGRAKHTNSSPRNKSTARSDSRPSSKDGAVKRSPSTTKEAHSRSRTPARRNSHSSSRPSSRNGPSSTSPGRRGRSTNTNRTNSPVKKESQSPTEAARRPKSRSASTSSGPKKTKKTVPLYNDLPDATEDSCTTFQVIPDCLYGSKNMGSTDVDALDCDCQEEWHGGVNHSCGEDSDCINRATKMECVTDAGNCGAGCQNQRFQRKQFANVSVIKTDKKGFGLRANKNMQANDFIFEYIGEVINEPTFRRRMIQYDQEGIKHFYFMSLTKHEFVDATKKGNLGRFCNHSCNPNCYVDKWVVGDKLRMGIFTSRPIEAGEELVFNYNVDRYGAEPQPCYCGEANCTGYIGGKTQTERGTKLSLATVEALGIDDGSSWDTAVAKKPRKKKPEEDDEEYVSRIEARGLDEEGVKKVMAQLMQCKEKWIAVKLLQRIQSCDDRTVIFAVLRMHGYHVLKTVLTTFIDDNNVVMQVLAVLDKFPRETRNKIQDSKIETAVQKLVGREGHDKVSDVSKRLLAEWEKLPVGFRIGRRKVDPNAPAAINSFEERRNIDRQDPKAKEDTISGDVPRGPRSNVPQRNNNFFGGPRPPKKRFNGPPLPQGWYSATDERGNLYYYTKDGATKWDRPTEPAPVVQKSADIAKQRAAMLQNIIEQVTKEQPRQQLTPKAATPQPAEAPATDSRKDWRGLPVDKQMKIFENTIHKHIKSVVDKYKTKFTRDALKKYFKEISKLIVLHEYQKKRVDNPTAEISRDQARNFKLKTKEYLDKAIVKEKKAALRNAALPAPSSAPAAGTAVEADATPVDLADVIMSDVETGSVSSQERKRKRGAEDLEMPSPMREASETPSAKRLKDEDAADIATPPPPPPPPAAAISEAGTGILTAEHIALIEQEQALIRENEEAERLEKVLRFTSGLGEDQAKVNGHETNGDAASGGHFQAANMDQQMTQ
ncbi:SET domain-containing protein [Plectosphaerella plurivora]|uniref:Histone-lysine N-methyltransferase, H3 lysine-36 specific n=1 Tax=Plectosphaerella plurivora TaxID=936078 RepID=A0A9P8V467_9PEZI|nr:SET domain-containing protein [Plectosphaerella plurivora]